MAPHHPQLLLSSPVVGGLGWIATGLWVISDRPVDGTADNIADDTLNGAVDGAGHWMQQEQPETVSRLLLDFLRGM